MEPPGLGEGPDPGRGELQALGHPAGPQLRDFLQNHFRRGRERDRELETSMREKHRSAASCTPPTGDVPTTKVHALTRIEPGTFHPQADPLSTEPNRFRQSVLTHVVKRGRERDRESETSMREKHRSAASCTPPTGDVSETK
ncbi:hypothetical protein QTO34_007649, partial [Cnephaeus nilssonii]